MKTFTAALIMLMMMSSFATTAQANPLGQQIKAAKCFFIPAACAQPSRGETAEDREAAKFKRGGGKGFGVKPFGMTDEEFATFKRGGKRF